MKKKYTYPLLIILFTLGYLLFEKYAEEQIDTPIVEQGKSEKAATNTYFLPLSTTGAVVHHNYYSLSYSEKHEQAEWVAYELTKNQVQNKDFKRPYFEVDPAVKSKSAHWRNYKNSGYDRGHKFNAGVWNRLEQKVRYWAKKYDGVYVVTGGILKDEIDTIGSENVTVPGSFYKIIYDRSGGEVRMLAFLMDSEESKEPLYKFVTSVDKIESLTGIDFFPELEDAQERKLEAGTSYKGWSFR